MLDRTAEESFEKGMRALENNRWREALAYFEAAIQLERRNKVRQPQARYLSYYGLCLGLSRKRTREAINFCRQAALIEGFNPDLRWNLGRVLMAAGRRREAYEAYAAGLRQAPDHPGLRRELTTMGWRKRPVLAFLARENPLNIALGRMRGR